MKWLKMVFQDSDQIDRKIDTARAIISMLKSNLTNISI